MNILTKKIVHAILVLAVLFTIGFANNADSLVYGTLRMRIATIDSDNPALSTADALAEAGLFVDAVAILREHALIDTVSKETGKHKPQPRPTQWRISSGIDYYHLEDVDSVAMTAEEFREYKRLTETPLSVWLRTKSTIQPKGTFVSEISPEVYLSERKGRLSVSARSLLLGNFLYIEQSIKAEKWFRAGAGDTLFAPARKQPSDMSGLTTLLTLTNSGRSPEALVWSVPVALDWEHYRENQPGYESFVEYGISPSLEVRPRGSSVGARLSAQARYEDYYHSNSDLLDAARFTGRLEGFGRNEKYNVLLTAAWMSDWYTNATSPESINRLEGGGRFEYKVTNILSGHLRLRAIHEREKHRFPLESMVLTIHGSELIVEPAIETAIGSHIKITPELLWERRWSSRQNEQSIWDARLVWEPGMRCRWSSTILDASVRVAFRAENIAPGLRETIDDSRSFRGAVDGNLNLNQRISVNLFADYQYRLYSSARISENISLSAAITARL